MLKKIFKALTTLTLLVGCYFGYVHVFAILVEQLRAIRHTDTIMFRIHEAKSKLESIRYAQETFGPNHWTADDDLAYRYYNAERGYWIYAREYERIVEENGVRYDGKRIRLTPFAMITKSRDGKSTKTITSDVAVFDLNEPLSFNVSAEGEPLKIKHAHLEPNVQVRDRKGTPLDPSDDMTIGMTTADYDEATQQISTESHVVIEDPKMVADGDGMLIQLRKDDVLRPTGSSAGFHGAERLDLLKNVHVVMRDVGKSGIMFGSDQARRARPTKVQAKTEILSTPDQEAAETAEPTPLDVRCDSKMQVYLPKERLPVLIGPPAPPAPTLVQFDRNVVVLRGQPDARPDELTCDTLRLSLVPDESPPRNGIPAPGTNRDPSQSAEGMAQASADAKAGPEAKSKVETMVQEAVVLSGIGGNPGNTDVPKPKAEFKTGEDGNDGLFGGLTLQRAHATGHAVWLYLPIQGVKLRCNELIHVRQAPFKPDQTYFQGDRTRPLELEKLDVIEDEGPDQGKITSVTNIWTVDATLFDNGNGLDTANVVAHGPGRLETRPDRNQPVERIAIWQDKFILKNELGPEGQVLHKIVDLTGNRPCFIDKLQETSIDSAYLIKVRLKPKTAARERGGAAGQTATPAASTETATRERGGAAGLGGGNLQIEHLNALRDVHLIAPAKTMTAREWLDAEFTEPEVIQAASTAPSKANEASTQPSPSPDQVPEQGQEQVTAQDQAKKPSAETPMIGSCDRMWARLALEPKSESDKASSKPTATTKTSPTRSVSGETNAEIRKVWMWGNVALHQDPAEGKTKGQEASGEALYLDNRGTGKAITYIYQRDPNEKTFLPGPLPPARVENQEINIAAAGIIRMNQETDQAWVDGPGTLTQLSDRGFLTDKAPGAAADDEETSTRANAGAAPQTGSPSSKVKTRTTSLLTQNDAQDQSTPRKDKAADSKPTTRAGRPLSEKVAMTIGFSENMEFTGRSIDTEGRPAARIDFHGIITAEMEDALLHCKEKMIAFTDQEVPLAQLGAMSQAQSKSKTAGDAPETSNVDGEAKPKAQLALIFCYRNAVAISRKVDPDAPILIQKQKIEADKILAYDRRTGDFFVQGKGKVYLYDRSDNSSQAPGLNPDGDGNNSDKTSRGLTPTQRTVTPTAGRAPNRGSANAGAGATSTRSPARPTRPRSSGEPEVSEIPPLVLTQIHFNKGMRGRFGTGKENDTVETRWSEFFGNIESMRAKVADAQAKLNPDRLPSDGLFLTGQTLRVITEPPPVGSPKSAPARNYMKAWEKAYVFSNDRTLQGDVITYDSYKDLIYAYGEQGRGVIFAEQHAAGQSISPGSSRAVQLNPKTGSLHVIDSDNFQMIDKNTGVRPSAEKPIDPYAKKTKPPKKPFKLPNMNIERRGFTGQ